MEKNYGGSDAALLSLKRKAKLKKKDAKEAAFRYLDYDGSIADMNTATVHRFLDFIEVYENNRL